MIDKTHPLPIAAQCRLVNIACGCVYDQPTLASEADLRLMRRLDELHLEYPFFGSRKLRPKLREEGFDVGRRHVCTLMRRMGLDTIYRKPRTLQPKQRHKVYPYLLKDLTITRPNQVWASDIIYIPMAHGFGYLLATVDLFSRKVLAHRLSNMLTTDFCVQAPQEALGRFGPPKLFNTDQGAQFTDADFTAKLKEHGVAIRMDGNGRWIDNAFVERLWRSVKDEEVYLKAYAWLAEARGALSSYFALYNTRRPHQSLDNRTPDAVYFGAQAAAERSAA